MQKDKKTKRRKEKITKRQYTGLIRLPGEFQWAKMNYGRLIGQKDEMTERQKDKKMKRTQKTYKKANWEK